LGAIVRALLVGGAALVALASSDAARCAELPLTPVPRAPTSAAVSPNAFDWTGFYLGGHMGYAWGRSNFTATSIGRTAPPFDGSLDFSQEPNGWFGTGSYFAGLQAGYNFMLPSRLVLGVEADAAFPSLIAGAQGIRTVQPRDATFEDDMLISGTVRGRLGYAFGNWLPYATAGFAWTFDRAALTQFAPVDGRQTALERQLLWRLGWTIGAGVEFPFAPNWTVRAEYLFTRYDGHGATFAGAAEHVDMSNLSASQVRLGLNYHLPSDSAGWNAITSQTLPPDLQNVAIHAQTTYINQYAFPFRNPYQGRNSLASNSGREGWDVTLYAGFRPWQGAEIWVNPEIDQGFALSDFHGVAGFVNNDPSKGSSYPFARIQRAFFQQTIDLGGEVQHVEADLNQFAMTQAENRLVVTVGKFAVGDVFDLNKYAWDARTDFMNLAVVSTGTFDYAADTFGYTYGATAEWYQGPWTVRVGYFDLSQVAAGEELSPGFHKFQWVGEIERRYDLWGKPGKVLVTAFSSRADLGTYNDAVSQSQLTGQPASVALVARPRSRRGISMNMEQQLTPDLGFFARGGIADPNVQDYEITDIDRTVAAGLSQNGKPWGRPNDTVGIAGVVNSISSAHQAYFNAGGMGIVIGDGMLPHPGLEQIIETYYSYAWSSLVDISLDYQLVNNPAYNRDRGPASVVAVRLHADF
jgi:high affinity Mn2+ porin